MSTAFLLIYEAVSMLFAYHHPSRWSRDAFGTVTGALYSFKSDKSHVYNCTFASIFGYIFCYLEVNLPNLLLPFLPFQHLSYCLFCSKMLYAKWLYLLSDSWKPISWANWAKANWANCLFSPQ